ncbi:N-Dimethylarginine dimethylaminohydrolase [Gracilibacillus orientalis]|uniref:N-Dimethylarginine dimethylaminohydrolase n=1 Tax=Gracilibacillus orientalis TaxID=334253 RepID=A0A1I4R0M7_9BACI|nr:arginine deiminase family protein [Gracilibacillus orientalis]SFM45483.1 N-Dimethylarginine dimethylaminohydrolase [Gracilibacillus orientalis]
MIFQQNEYDRLKRVIVCPPTYMEIRNVINETQKFYEDENIDVNIAMKQHERFVQTLNQFDIEVIELMTDSKLNEQVFTRDIGFVAGDTLFTCEMGRNIRKPEIDVLQQFLEHDDLPYIPVTTRSIEGGDIVVADDKVYVGRSLRTTTKAIEDLQKQLPEKEVIAVQIREDILHLDCCFNLVSDKVGIIYNDAFNEKERNMLHNQYDLIELTDDEQFTLGTNVFSIGNQKVISLPENKLVNEQLRKKGFEVIEIQFSEIIKSGGSFRCCTLPMERGK